MKERGEMTSVRSENHLPTFIQPPPSHHDHRLNKKNAGGDEMCRDLPTRGAEINLLANSLSSRLRKAARHRMATTTTATTTTNTSNEGTRSAPPEESTTKSSKSVSKQDRQTQSRPSILKRTSWKEDGDQQQHSMSRTVNDFHLPDVFMDQRMSPTTANLDHITHDMEKFNNQYLDRPAPLAIFGAGGGRGIGGGGGGGGGGGFSRSHNRNGHVTWVKRSGIFQPADKYAPGRQSLHGDDQPFALSHTVNYETVTLSSSRPESPQSDGVPSGKGLRKKGLKVSWKQPSISEGHQGEENTPTPRPTNTSASSSRQRSAGTVHSDVGSFAYVKPKFKPGRSHVAGVGVKWKVPTPTVGRPPSGSSCNGDVGRPSSGESSGHVSPASTHSLPATFHPTSPSKYTTHTRDSRHPWRALYPRDVHPMTTAMEREGTSVSKTKWHVPNLRPVPAFTFIEDLMDSNCYHWHHSAPPFRHNTRATVDAQSAQNRLQDHVSCSSKGINDVATASISSSTERDPQGSTRS